MSRYTNSYKYIYEGKPNMLTFPSYPAGFFNQFMSTPLKVNENDTLDTLAFEYFDGRGDLFWIIMLANNLSLPTDIQPNMILRIPLDYKSIEKAIASLNGVT